jgi:hypothetical protein
MMIPLCLLLLLFFAAGVATGAIVVGFHPGHPRFDRLYWSAWLIAALALILLGCCTAHPVPALCALCVLCG